MKISTWLSLVIVFSLLVGALPAAATDLPTETEIAVPDNPSETFLAAYRSGDAAFRRILAGMAGEAVVDTLDTQSVRFFEQFQSATEDELSKVIDKARDAKAKQYEAQKSGGSQPSPTLILAATRPDSQKTSGGDDSNGSSEAAVASSAGPTLAKASAAIAEESPAAAPDQPQVTHTETDTSSTATASVSHTNETDTANITQSSTKEGHVEFKDNAMITESTIGEKVEAASKTSRDKVTKTFRFTTRASFDVCPDAQGVVRGTGKAIIYSQTTYIKGSEIAALTTEYTSDFKITGYVDSSAEFTHFDMTGTVTERLLGFDRAVRVGMLDDAGGLVDGSKTISYEVNGNTPPNEVSGASGMTHPVHAKWGPAKRTPAGIYTQEAVNRIIEAGENGIGGIMIELELLMRSSRSRWRNYECIAVEAGAPKTVLQPNESVEVTVFSESKLDRAKIDAALEGVGTETVAPKNQNGSPSADFTLTAPAKGKAEIVVTSVSKRGIGIGGIEIPVTETKKPPAKTPPKKPEPCDGNWNGTVKAVRVHNKDLVRPTNGALVRSIETIRETFSVSVQLLGTRDTTGGIENNYVGDAHDQYLKKEYRELNYAPAKMSCGDAIITSPQTQKFEIQTKGDANQRVLVAISINENWGYFGFSPPEIQADQIFSQTYESNCPSYNAINTKTDHSEYKQGVSASFEVEFTVDESKPDVVTGSKTVQESDGSETTYTWDLIRCT